MVKARGMHGRQKADINKPMHKNKIEIGSLN